MALSRAADAWGCEMGVNEHGLAVLGEAVFTRLPVAREDEGGLSGPALQRLALERCRSADDALALIIELLARFAQRGWAAGAGGLGHAAFLLADPEGAWLLESAGELWAAARVRGRRALSGALTIDDDFDKIHPGALAFARARGWCRSGADFGFARCFGDPRRSFWVGAAQRRRRSTRGLIAASPGGARAEELAALLRDHAGAPPGAGLRMPSICAHRAGHTSWLPTRSSSQTCASMLATLPRGGAPRVWMTGTSSPCLSVFKPLCFAPSPAWREVLGSEGESAEGLWWAHEAFHRAVLADWDARAQVGAAARDALEARAFAHVDAPLDDAACLAMWREHRAALPSWRAEAEARPVSAGGSRLGDGARSLRRYWLGRTR
nr:carcinine hydrolase/isopenicillin-N N-acyltransferase family protein [Pseudenhygromyxa sp. WMMC2535]